MEQPSQRPPLADADASEQPQSDYLLQSRITGAPYPYPFQLVRTRTSDGSAHFPEGTVVAAAQYHLDVTVHGSTEILAINGSRVCQFTETTMTGGDSVGFIVYGLNSDAQADFKNFVFKTLP